ncbi:2-hydroxychromene-2-carboxylate isomerase [Noviherbaspirillum aerium]|uniref:2-hydroxychromene-2-carboxylate isomerase n=1 Tax=Noviherbaspirillum aerium TaxID=2588497 RepID=UPI00124DAB08|nr:2-hydroxychromene-2-carboxylate isomerase [Noviherbaspirillum aerium]
MSRKVEFFFDVGSPYSYLAYHQLPKIAQATGAEVTWKPMLLGAVLKATANQSPMAVPLKGQHLLTDLQRWADHFGVVFVQNPHFPINTLHLMRGAIGMQMAGEAEFRRYLDAVFHAMFGEPRNLNEIGEVIALLTENGFDPQRFQAMINDPAVKDALKRNTDDAVERGVFGAPTFFVGNEMYWGQDRLHFVEAALR